MTKDLSLDLNKELIVAISGEYNDGEFEVQDMDIILGDAYDLLLWADGKCNILQEIERMCLEKIKTNYDN